MNIFGLVWKNISRNRRWTVLTVFSIARSLFLLSALMTVLTELERESPDGRVEILDGLVGANRS